MARYLMISSRDPFESNDVAHYYELATGLAQEGNEVTLFLVQNGVMPARRSSRSEALESMARAGVKILADDFSLRERGIASDRLTPSVSPSPLDVVVDQLAEGRQAMWH